MYIGTFGTANSINLYNNDTMVMRITPNGYVGIGTTTPLRSLHNGSREMIITDAQTGVANWQKWRFYSYPDSANGNKENLYLGMINDAGLGLFSSMQFAASGKVGIGIEPSYTLHVNGSVAGTGDYVALSDARLKKDVQTIGDALAIVEALRGVTFNWDQTVDPTMKLDDRNHVGFLAQEVEAVLPQAVSTATDARQTKSVAYSEVIPVLTEAIKQLKAENDALKARLDALEAKLGQ